MKNIVLVLIGLLVFLGGYQATAKSGCTANKKKIDCKVAGKSLYCTDSLNAIFDGHAHEGDRITNAVVIRNTCLNKIVKGALFNLTISEFICKNNNLKFLHEQTFGDMPQLQRIDLSRNALHRRSIFKNLTGAANLQYLNLANNTISFLPNNGLPSFPRLKLLNLDGNNITQLAGSTFVQCENLRILSLRGNKIKTIALHAFRGLKYLTQLHLDGNLLKRLGKATSVLSTDMISLEVLTASYNLLTKWPNIVFPQAQVLNLAHNKIENIGSMPSSLPNLRILILSQNQLRGNFSTQLADLFPKMSHLDLGNNMITSIERNAFTSHCGLKYLVLYGNPLHEFHIQWFERVIEREYISGISVGPQKMICNCTHLQYNQYLQKVNPDIYLAFKYWQKMLDKICHPLTIDQNSYCADLIPSHVNCSTSFTVSSKYHDPKTFEYSPGGATPTTTTTTPTELSGGISAAAIAAIVLGIVVLVLGLGVVASRRKKRTRNDQHELLKDEGNNEDEDNEEERKRGSISKNAAGIQNYNTDPKKINHMK